MRLLERDEPLQILAQLHDQATKGIGRLIFIEGEAGIGKTSLVREFMRALPARCGAWLGSCDPIAAPRPFGPLLEVALDADSALAVLIENGAQPTAIFRAFLTFLRGEPGTVVAIDDLHWADAATLDLLRFIGRRVASTGALMVGTYRDDEVGAEHPLQVVLGDLATTQAVRRLTVEPLSQPGVAELASGTNLDPIELHDRTGGNPFFVTEVVAGAPAPIPRTVRDAVLARVARLTPAGRATLEAAAVIGRTIDPRLLEIVVDEFAASDCLAKGLLIADEAAYRFRHEVARQAVLTAIDPSRRQALHRKVLLALEDRGETPVAILADHAVQGRLADAILRHALAAAGRSTVAGAHREAAALLTSAEPFVGRLPPPERARFFELLAQEQFVTAGPDTGLGAFEQAAAVWRALADPVEEVRVLSEAAKSYVATGRNRETTQLEARVGELTERLPSGPVKVEAYNALAYLRYQERDPAAIELGRRAIELAGDDPRSIPSVVMAWNSVGGARLQHGDPGGVADLERSLALALRYGLDRNAAHAYANLIEVMVEQYRFDDAQRYLDTGLRYVAGRELDAQRLYLEAYQAIADVHRGRWGAAEARLDELFASRFNSVIGQLMALTAAGRLRARRGHPDAQAALDAALERAEPIGTAQRVGLVRAARAELAWLAGETARASMEARAAIDLAVHADDRWLIGELAWWLGASDRESGPVELAELAAHPWRAQLEGRWRDAAEAWEAVDCPYEAARALLDSDDPDDVGRARRVFDQLGARPGLALAVQRLRQLGIRSIPRGPRPSTRADPLGLTTRESEVAKLVASGLTNDQIAARLFLSRRTIDHHVSAILGKLGVVRRTEIRTAIRNRSAEADAQVLRNSQYGQPVPMSRTVRRGKIAAEEGE